MTTGLGKTYYSRISLGVISLTFWMATHIWFYPTSLGYLASGSRSSRQCYGGLLLSAVGLKFDESLIGHFHKFCTTVIQHILQVGKILGQRFYGWVEDPVPTLEALPLNQRMHKKMWHSCAMDYYSAVKNDIMKFSGKWMVLENIIQTRKSNTTCIQLWVYISCYIKDNHATIQRHRIAK